MIDQMSLARAPAAESVPPGRLGRISALRAWLTSRFELSRGDDANLKAMEGLRGFAVLLVFLVHYTTLVTPWIPLHSLLAFLAVEVRAVGHSGVDLFFVLSGYLIYGSLISRSWPFLKFLRRRIQRLYPVFVAVFFLYVALSCLIPTESKIPQAPWPAFLFLTANFLLLPGIFDITPMITVAWSLSFEMFYYLLTPALIAVAGLRNRSGNARVAFFLAIAVLFVAYCSVFGGPLRLVMFLAGILLFEVLQRRLLPAPRTMAGLSCLAGGWLILLVPTTGHLEYSLQICALALAFFVLCFSCFGGAAPLATAVFSWTPLRWLGNMSYSYYLVHGVTLLGFFRLFQMVSPPRNPSWVVCVGLLPVSFAVSLVPSACLFLMVERPFSLKPATRQASFVSDRHAHEWRRE